MAHTPRAGMEDGEMTVLTIKGYRAGLEDVERTYGLHAETIGCLIERIARGVEDEYRKAKLPAPAELHLLNGVSASLRKFIDFTDQLAREDARRAMEEAQLAIPTETLFETVERVQG
jgi:hypothetical protein